MSDEEEERVGTLIDTLIERGCKRVSEENVDKAVQKKELCQICQFGYSGPCFSLSACAHIFHSNCMNNLFENCATNKHVICPCCKGQHATMGIEGQAELLAQYRLIHKRAENKNKRLANRMRKMENSARKCQLMVRYFLASNHFKN